MFESKYSKLLTVLLAIVIIAILGLLGFLGYNYYKKYQISKEASEFVDNFILSESISRYMFLVSVQTLNVPGENELGSSFSNP